VNIKPEEEAVLGETYEEHMAGGKEHSSAIIWAVAIVMLWVTCCGAQMVAAAVIYALTCGGICCKPKQRNVESASDPGLEMGSFDLEDDDDSLTIQDGVDGKYDGDFSSIHGEYGDTDVVVDSIGDAPTDSGGDMELNIDDVEPDGEEMDLDELEDLEEL
jgi:hypothetical protein